jgi:hypothetical protein
MSEYPSDDREEPRYPARMGRPGPSIVRESDPPACGPRPAEGAYPPQGEHHAAGGRPEHHRPDGGTGLGHRAPAGWPEYRPGR